MGASLAILFVFVSILWSLNASGQDSATIRKDIEGLVARLDEFSAWAKNHPEHLDACNGCRGKLRRDAGINHLELRLSTYVRTWMDALLKRDDKELVRMYSNGHECTAMQAKAQAELYKSTRPHICAEIEVYKLLHLALPDLRTFVDVGANRGFIGATFVGMWGGFDHGITPNKFAEESIAMNLYPNNRNPHGYCRTGLNHAYPLYCPAAKRSGLGECHEKKDIRVFSVDGSSSLKSQVSKAIQKFGAEKYWSYQNFAVSDEVGFTTFTRQNATHMAGLEGGYMGATGDTETVPMTSIDALLQEEDFEGAVDVIKIDAESFDLIAILGARKTIEKGVKIVTYEHSRVSGRAKAQQAWKMLRDLKFSCYSAAFKWMYKMDDSCLDGTWLRDVMKLDWGNVYCVSQVHAPAAVAALDAVSFLPIQAHMKNPTKE